MRDKALHPTAGFLANIAILKSRDRPRWADQQQIDVSVHGTVNVLHIARTLHEMGIERDMVFEPEYRDIALEGPDTVRDTAGFTVEEPSYDGDSST